VCVVCADKQQKYETLKSLYDFVDSIGQTIIFTQVRMRGLGDVATCAQSATYN